MNRIHALLRRPSLFFVLLLICSSAHSQIPSQLDTGYPENAIFHGTEIENVQINNGGLHVEIPIYSAKGRGLDVWAKVVYNSKDWTFHTRCFTSGGGFCEDDVAGDPLGNPQLGFYGSLDYIFNASSRNCQAGVNLFYFRVGGYILREPNGTKHHFVPDPLTEAACVPPPNPYPSTVYADDGSGWIMQINPTDGSMIAAISKTGEKIQAACGLCATKITAASITDTNGNQLLPSSACCANSGLGGTDTLGRTIPANGGYYDSSGTLRLPSFSGSVAVAIDTTPLCEKFSNADTCVADTETWNLPTQLNLPNGDIYTFTYAQNGAGELASITLPTGGQISYTWGTWDEGGRNVATRTVSADGITGTWTYNGGTVTDPAGKDTQYSFGNTDTIDYFDGPAGASPLIKSVSTDHLVTASYTVPIRVTTTWPQFNLVTQTETDWDLTTVPGVGTVTRRSPVEKRLYDWTIVGNQPRLLKRIHYSYRHLEADGGAYLNANIADLPTLIQTFDGAGNLVAQTQNSYDGGTLLNTGACQTPGVPSHDYCNYGSSMLTRGNLTQSSHWLNTNNTWVSATNTYDDLGNLRSTTDPGGHPTTFDYTDSWGGTGCVTAASTLAFPTTVTDALGHRVKTSYFPCTSLVQSKRDENDIQAGRSGTTYTYDLMNRPLVTQVLDTNGGLLSKTSFSYNDSVLPLSITKTVTASPDPDIVSTVTMDGLGRTSQTILNDPEGNVTTETVYDSLGRKASVTNPHRAVPAATDGTTRFVYDTLGRTTDVIKPDGNTVHTDYAGNATTVTDETLRQRRSVTDGLGQLIEVDEPGDFFAGTPSGGTLPVNGSLRSTVVGGQNAAQATASLNITGTEQSVTVDPCGGAAAAPLANTSDPNTGGGTVPSTSNAPTPNIIGSCPKTYFDHGTVTITVNGHADSTSYGSTSTSATVASGLASAINADSAAVVTASSSGSTLFLTAKQFGPGGDYSWSATAVSTDTTGNFGPGASFNPSPSSGALTGGANAVTGTTVWDTGAVSVSVGGFTGQAVPYGSSNAVDVRFTNDSCTACSGTAGGGDRNLFVNSITVGSTTILPTDPSVSYVGAPCNATSNGVAVLACNGDFDATTTATGSSITISAYGSPDAGVYPTMQLLVNGTLIGQWTVTGTAQNYTVNVPAGDTTATQLATALAATLNVSSSPVTASVSGSSIVINYKSVGTAGNVAATINTAPSNPSLFPGGSFSGSTSLAGGQDSFPSGLAHPYVTMYRYDTLGNLYCVEQHGNANSGTACPAAAPGPSDPPVAPDPNNAWRRRLFAYDSLSRLRWSSNPESGIVSYQYDGDSNVTSKTDARGITIAYGYDQDHRLTQKTYSDGSPGESYYYDVTPALAYNPPSHGASIGRLTHASNNVNSAYDPIYDPLGRVIGQVYCIPSKCDYTTSVGANYDAAGSLISLTYPDGRTVTTSYSAAGRMTNIKVGTFSYYTVPQGGDPTTWGYWPTGAMNRGTYGNGVIETTGFNARLQVSSISDAKGSTTLFSKSYGYYDSAGHNNGDILSIADTLNSARSQTYSYDSLNRVVSGAQADNSFNVVHRYDAWGNMTESGTSNFQPLFDGSNRMVPSAGCTPNLSPYCVDAAGDLLKDNQGHVYTYDVEARIKTVDGTVASYGYGPDGSRIRKDANGSATEYIYFGGNVIAEKNVTTGAWTDYIFGYGGKRIAKDTSTNGSAAQYYQDDHLGTTRVMTDAAGTVISNCTFNAFGEQIACSPDNASNHYRYAGKERDTESGLDDFGARYYSSTMGRWTTPDWSERPTAIPYAVFGDPQSLNLYLYVRNDPVSNADADGHFLNEIWAIFTGAPNGAAAQKAVDIPPGTMGAPQTDPNQKFSTDQSGNIICTGNCSGAAAIKDGAEGASNNAEVTVTGSVGPVTVNSKGDVNTQVVPSLGVSVDVTVPKPNPDKGPTTTVGAGTPGGVQLSGGVNLQNGSVSGVTVSVGAGIGFKSLEKINPAGLNVGTDKEGAKSFGRALKDIFVKGAAAVGFIGPI